MTFELLASELTNLVDKIANSSYYVISATPLDLKLKEPTPTNMFFTTYISILAPILHKIRLPLDELERKRDKPLRITDFSLESRNRLQQIMDIN